MLALDMTVDNRRPIATLLDTYHSKQLLRSGNRLVWLQRYTRTFGAEMAT